MGNKNGGQKKVKWSVDIMSRNGVSQRGIRVGVRFRMGVGVRVRMRVGVSVEFR